VIPVVLAGRGLRRKTCTQILRHVKCTVEIPQQVFSQGLPVSTTRAADIDVVLRNQSLATWPACNTGIDQLSDLLPYDTYPIHIVLGGTKGSPIPLNPSDERKVRISEKIFNNVNRKRNSELVCASIFEPEVKTVLPSKAFNVRLVPTDICTEKNAYYVVGCAAMQK
jgi:hypothetical protein